jgi:hypothetical protein
LKTIKAELKKHCISIVTRQRYEDFNVVQDGDPPFFDFVEAAEKGSFTRFFEQAFEWDQMQYVFYPYFWGRKSTWSERFLRQDVDPAFLEFLQAGAARVVVPVRPGFEVALTHYLETLEIWNGEGEPPTINSPLYVPHHHRNPGTYRSASGRNRRRRTLDNPRTDTPRYLAQ